MEDLTIFNTEYFNPEYFNPEYFSDYFTRIGKIVEPTTALSVASALYNNDYYRLEYYWPQWIKISNS